MLKTEQNTMAMARRVLKAANKRFHKRLAMGALFFEHGQWWLSMPNGAQYSVVDAEGFGAVDGFDFEQVTDEDEY